MKKWFEYQESLQKKTDAVLQDNFIEFNIAEAVVPIREWALKKNLQIEKNDACFNKKTYIEEIIKSYPESKLDTKTIESWILDPEFDNLMNVAGKRIRILTDDEELNFIKNILKPYFKIDWNSAQINVHVQAPGQMSPLHYDRYKSWEFENVKENLVNRWLIMLDDQKPGQCFFMDQKSVHWKKGDVIGWTHVILPHGSANFGYWPRFNIRLTGKRVDK